MGDMDLNFFSKAWLSRYNHKLYAKNACLQSAHFICEALHSQSAKGIPGRQFWSNLKDPVSYLLLVHQVWDLKVIYRKLSVGILSIWSDLTLDPCSKSNNCRHIV